MDILDSKPYIKRIKRKSLAICINLAQNLGFEDSKNAENLVKMLNQIIRDNESYIKKEDLLAIKPYLLFLLDYFSKLNNALQENENDLSEHMNELKISENKSLPESFSGKLDFTSFDDMIDIRTGGIATHIWDALENAGVWEASPDLVIGKIIAYGKFSKDKFFESTKEVFSNDLVEYRQKTPSEKKPRDDGCNHSGCKINFSDIPELIIDFRGNLTKEAKEILSKYQEDDQCLGGTIGVFVKTTKRHYLVTAAHNLFPELSRMKTEDSSKFNNLVPFVQYDSEYDVAMIEVYRNSPHDNGLAIAPCAKWGVKVNLYEGNTCYKLGGTTGLTIGEFDQDLKPHSYQNGNLLYKSLLKVSPKFQKCFATTGDSGSIYYVETQDGFIPLAIHRTSRDERTSYGVPFLENFRKILEKLDLDFDGFYPCQKSNVGFSSACQVCHTTHYNPPDI